MSNRDYLVDYMHKNLTTVGRGHFAIHLNFYSDSNYQHQFSGFPPSYMIGDLVYVKVLTNIRDYGIKMRISECSTKPSEHSSSTYIYYLIRNGQVTSIILRRTIYLFLPLLKPYIFFSHSEENSSNCYRIKTYIKI